MFSVIRVTSGGKPDQSFCFRTRKDLDRFRVFCRIYAAESGGNSHGSYHIGSQLADRIVRGSPLVGPRALPHLSMIHLMADGVLEQEIPTLLSMCMGQFRAVAGYDDFVGTLGSLRLFGNWWFWLTPRTPELDHLHDVCVQVFAPRRAGDVEISWPMNDDQREMHRKYGYPAVLRGFIRTSRSRCSSPRRPSSRSCGTSAPARSRTASGSARWPAP